MINTQKLEEYIGKLEDKIHQLESEGHDERAQKLVVAQVILMGIFSSIDE